eukprot:gene11877-5204_t
MGNNSATEITEEIKHLNQVSKESENVMKQLEIISPSFVASYEQIGKLEIPQYCYKQQENLTSFDLHFGCINQNNWKLFDFTTLELIDGPEFPLHSTDIEYNVTLNDEYIYGKNSVFLFNGKYSRIQNLHSISNDGHYALTCEKNQGKIYQTSMLRENINEKKFYRKFMVLGEIEDINFSYDSKFVILIHQMDPIRRLVIFSIEENNFIFCFRLDLNGFGCYSMLSLQNSIILGFLDKNRIQCECVISLKLPFKNKYCIKNQTDINFKFVK